MDRKSRYKRARELGFSTKDAAKMRYWSDDKFTKTIHKKERQREASDKYHRAREAGFSTKEASKMRYWSLHHFQEELNRVLLGGDYLTIYWRDKLEDADAKEVIAEFKHAYKHVSNEYLILSILGFMQIKEGYIGTTQVLVADEKQKPAMDRFYYDWGELYHGKGDPRRYHELLVAINAGVQLVYLQFEKAMFVNQVIGALKKVNPDTARRLQNDLKINHVEV